MAKGRFTVFGMDVGKTWAWALPADATCARAARRLVRETLVGLGVAEETVDDATLMVSELATNAHQHAAGHPPHELWIYRLDECEFSCAIFDGLATREHALAFERGDFGRGLRIVAELSKGRWGTDTTFARLAPQATGKAVWFSCPL